MKRILESRPDLLLKTPPQNMSVQTLAGQIFYAEAVPLMLLSVAKIAMLKTMRPYFDKLPSDAATAMLEAIEKAWPYKTDEENIINPHQTCFHYGEEIQGLIIPEEYLHFAASLLTPHLMAPITDTTNLPQPVKAAFLTLFNILLPKKAVHLDDYMNPEVLLLAMLETLLPVFNDMVMHSSFHSNIEVFCVRFIGLIQSVLSAEDAKNLCKGLIQVIYNEMELVEQDGALEIKKMEQEKVVDIKSYYPREGRPAFDSNEGLGFENYCGFHIGNVETSWVGMASYVAGAGLAAWIYGLQKLISIKQHAFMEVIQPTMECQAQPSSCRR